MTLVLEKGEHVNFYLFLYFFSSFFVLRSNSFFFFFYYFFFILRQGTGFKRLKLLQGTTMQLTLSTANRDPSVFGGRANSKAVANSFNPNRPDEELNKILSWNGVHEQVMTGEAPRGCIGYHVSFDVATKIISKFLPAVGGETQATQERKAAHDKATNIEDENNSVFSLKFSSLNTEVVYGISLLTYIIFIYYMKAHFATRETQSSLQRNKVSGTLSLIYSSGNAEYGVMSEQLASFLIGSCVISLSSMLDVPILKYLARLSQSYAMANMFLIIRAWKLDQNYYNPGDGRGKNNFFVSVFVSRFLVK